uniref:Uncharacterized protein n=1 Tax=Plectus sambesii TaxID=2011161 RepID=A0A914XER7_9BILA
MVLKTEPKAENSKETGKKSDEVELLMERIRQRAVSSKSWDELMNIAKKNMMEKRNVLDADDRMQLQESMVLLQRTRHGVHYLAPLISLFDDARLSKTSLRF